jgi:Tfp pilus assembly protein PilO
MVLSKRERILAIATLLVVGFLAIYMILVKPVMHRRQLTSEERVELEAQVQLAQNLFDRRKILERKWSTPLAEGMQSDADLETRVAKDMNQWAQETRLTLPSVKPERSTNEKGYTEITFVAAGRGSLEAVASFLYRVETSELPLKVTSMQLGSSESGDSISLQLRVSALYLGDSSKTPEETPRQPQSENNDEDEIL